jgi:hypothetical protein
LRRLNHESELCDHILLHLDAGATGHFHDFVA